MRYSDESYNLRIEVDAKQFELSPEDAQRLQASLSPLGKLVEDLPASDLYITISHHPRGGTEYRVKTALVLPAKTLFSGDTDDNFQPALGRCVDNLIEQVTAYKQAQAHADKREKHAKGTYQQVVSNQEPDIERLATAVRAGDYAQFRQATYPYEPSLRRRIGRWVGRYPELEAKLGTHLAIEDIKETVFLNAFENFDHRPRNVRWGRWLETLIDTSIKALLQNPDEELENVSFARTLKDLAREQRVAP